MAPCNILNGKLHRMRVSFSRRHVNGNKSEARWLGKDSVAPKMTQSIFDSVAANGRSHIESLRSSGTGSPLFCFPGAGDRPARFQELTSFLPDGQPVYAIDLDSLWGIEEEFTIEQLARFYLDLIRKIQRSGPYFLCGYSFGGLVVYEMAMRLIDEGDSVNLIALLDTPNPALKSNLSVTSAVQFHKTYLIDRLRKYCRMLVRCDFKQMTGSGLAYMTTNFGSIFLPAMKILFRMVNRPLPTVFGAHDPTTIFSKAWRSYVPKRHAKAKSVVFFRVRDRGPEYDHDLSMGWDTYLVGDVQVHIVPGGHLDMLSMPAVRVVAEKLAAYLDKGSNLKESVGAL
jgi:thioesterase domain-containing protein